MIRMLWGFADLGQMEEPVEGHSDLPLGIAERLGVEHVITLDRRHFGAVHPRHRERFTLLP
jgi:hypothetical protein